MAYDAGYEAHHVSHLGKSGASDQELVRYAVAEELIVVTNNARDFRRLMAAAELHPGLLVIVPNVISKAQRAFFEQVLDWIKKRQLAGLVNQLVEVDSDGIRIYDLPSPE